MPGARAQPRKGLRPLASMQPKYPILLVRHGQAEHHVKEITGGWSDTQLTKTGILQASLLGSRLLRELDGKPVELGTSNLRRAVQTAEVIGQMLKVKHRIFPSISDLNNGIAAGKTHAEARPLARPPTEPIFDWQPYPEAETWRQFFARVAQFMDAFSKKQRSPAVLVSHAATLHVIIAWWLGLSAESRTHFEVDPASLSVLRLNRWGEPSIERLNDTAHLYTPGLAESIRL